MIESWVLATTYCYSVVVYCAFVAILYPAVPSPMQPGKRKLNAVKVPWSNTLYLITTSSKVKLRAVVVRVCNFFFFP